MKRLTLTYGVGAGPQRTVTISLTRLNLLLGIVGGAVLWTPASLGYVIWRAAESVPAATSDAAASGGKGSPREAQAGGPSSAGRPAENGLNERAALSRGELTDATRQSAVAGGGSAKNGSTSDGSTKATTHRAGKSAVAAAGGGASNLAGGSPTLTTSATDQPTGGQLVAANGAGPDTAETDPEAVPDPPEGSAVTKDPPPDGDPPVGANPATGALGSEQASVPSTLPATLTEVHFAQDGRHLKAHFIVENRSPTVLRGQVRAEATFQRDDGSAEVTTATASFLARQRTIKDLTIEAPADGSSIPHSLRLVVVDATRTHQLVQNFEPVPGL